MATVTVSRQVRYHATGDGTWTYQTFGNASSINLDGLMRGKTYTIQVRNIDSAGRSSVWVSSTVTVGDTT